MPGPTAITGTGRIIVEDGRAGFLDCGMDGLADPAAPAR